MINFTEIKHRCLERFFARTNPQQREAIFHINGAVLIIAGAGSGKTTVLCNRIANMLLFGQSYNVDFERELSAQDEQFLCDFADGKIALDPTSTGRLSSLLGYGQVKPWRILAVTFTNKAAAELKERLTSMGAPGGNEVTASTFHSACVRILRTGIDKLGYSKSFTIYDSDDSLRVIKNCMKDLQISDKAFSPKEFQSKISRAKDQLITPNMFNVMDSGKRDFKLEKTKNIYEEYQKRLKHANALDFDDIIMKTVELFEKCPESLERWQKQFEYIMVDEYQDTNMAQYKLISQLAGGSGNLCVVGDEDQSIYRFRGATIENILSFEKQFDAKVVKLEQNYRSTKTILDAANAVISHNTQRKDKSLWSDIGEGEKISLNQFYDERSEAAFVAKTIMDKRENGGAFRDNVVLYRTNAQSRTVELALNQMAIPYRIIGGTKFYDRKEVKDILAYMSVVNNPNDTVRFARIINEPKRGIGDATQLEVLRVSEGLGLSPIEVLQRADEFAGLTKKSKILQPLGEMFRELGQDENRSLDMLIDDILTFSGYETMLAAMGDEGAGRLENIKELKSSAVEFMNENEDHTLASFLERVALISDMDNYEQDEDKVVLMTMHGAKGLEFDTVFIIGAEENIFPSYRSALDATEIEEERRLAYVAITRAKQHLYVTNVKQRLIYGQTMRNKLSRFIGEIPPQNIEFTDHCQSAGGTAPRPKKIGYLQAEARHANVERAAARTVSAVAAPATVFGSGDRITHRVFGEGTVINVTPMGNDYLLEVAFDKVGTKKIMANFAKVSKL